MKKILFLILLVGAGLVLTFGVSVRPGFNVSGVVEVSPRLKAHARRPNTECFVVVKNQADIPIAIHRYVNPVFPLKFSMDSGDLLFPNPSRENLKLEVQINNHGGVGELREGDMFAKMDSGIAFSAQNLNIKVDKMLGMPVLYAASKDDKGQHMFQTAR